MLPRRRMALLGTGTIQLRSGQGRLRGQHDRLGRSAGLQPLPRSGDGTLPLGNVELGDLALALRGDHRQVATRDFRQQVEAPGLALDRQGIDATLRQRATRIELAATLKE